MQRAYNFGAGPAMLPDSVLQRIKDEIFDWRGTGVSVMEIGHRTQIFQVLLQNLQVKLRRLMNIPDNYKILFLPGGAQAQFACIPMNLSGNNKQVDYFSTGVWSERAIGYAKNYANVNIVTTASNGCIPESDSWNLNSNAAYAYYCPNETINGIQFADIPDVGNVPLIADMTSSIASMELDINKFGVIFASAQKNLGIAGISLVIIRDDLLEQAINPISTLWSYKEQALQNSCVNTIPVFPVYVMDLMVDWIESHGGIASIEAHNKVKAKTLYNYIDNSGFYSNKVQPRYRSLLNVPFDFPSDELLKLFLTEATNHNLKYLNGHILVGGARASMYNAMPQSGVDALVAFMQDFAAKS